MSTKNGFLMNNSIIVTNMGTNLNNQAYTGFTFNGNCILDSICIRNYIKSDYEVINTSVTTLPQWTPDVKFLVAFNNTTDGSNIFGLLDSPETWSLYRRKYNDDILTKICEIDTDITSWIDYKCAGNMTYEYLIFANTTTQVSEPIVTDKIKTSFYGYFLISSDADINDENTNDSVETYKFDIDLQSDKVTINNDVTYLKNYYKYDIAVIGDRNFKSGSFTSTLFPTILSDYDFEGKRRWADEIDNLQAFIHDGKYKYFKNRNGEIMKVLTENSNSSFEYKYRDNSTVGMLNYNFNQVCDVTIYYNEIGDIN